jgi:hypothetical protein
VPVAHACNPSYSGGRDQEAHGSKSAQANSLQNAKLFTKRAGGVAQGEGPEFKPQYSKKKKKKGICFEKLTGTQNSHSVISFQVRVSTTYQVTLYLE